MDISTNGREASHKPRILGSTLRFAYGFCALAGTTAAVACASYITKPGHLPESDTTSRAPVTCEKAKPDEITAQGRQQAIAAEIKLAKLRNARPADPHPNAERLIIRLVPTVGTDDSAIIEAALQQARRVRAETGLAATIEFAPGRYRLRRTITLTDADSGTPDEPLLFAAQLGGPVILTGGTPLLRRPLPAVLAALVPAAQHKVVIGYGVPPDAVPSRPFPWRVGVGSIITSLPSFFALQGDQPLWRSAAPDSGYAVEAVAQPQSGPAVIPRVTIPPGLAQAGREPALQAGGYWTYDWAYEENGVVPDPHSIRQGAPTMLVMPQLRTRYPQAALMRYRLLNGFSFINEPGEMAYADGAIAAYPLPGAAPVEAAVVDHLVTISGAHDIRFDGLALQGARQDVVAIDGAHGIAVSNAYLGLAAQSAITIRRSNDIVVERSVITDVGEYGVAMESNAQTPSGQVLIADNIFARNAQLTRANHSAILLAGYDNVAMGNSISDLPHQAIVFSGARNLILGNEIAYVDQETTDAGAVNTFYDLSTTSNIIAQNYFHDITLSRGVTQKIASQVIDVYLDSWASFNNIENNLTDTDAKSFFINSGFQNAVRNNIWLLRGGPSGQIYDYSPHRNEAVGRNIFDDPKFRKLAACSDLSARFDPTFLRDGKPSRNVIAGNTNIGGRSVEIRADLVGAQHIADERLVAPAPVDRTKGLAGLLQIARKSGAPVGAYLQKADRSTALQGLRYASRRLASTGTTFP